MHQETTVYLRREHTHGTYDNLAPNVSRVATLSFQFLDKALRFTGRHFAIFTTNTCYDVMDVASHVPCITVKNISKYVKNKE